MGRIIKPSQVITSVSKNGANTLEFDEGTHRYKLNGKRVPGVTTVTHGGYVTSEALISWMAGQAADAALTRGLELGRTGVEPSQTERKEIIKLAKSASKEKSTAAAEVGTFVHDYAYHTELGQLEKAEEVVKKGLNHPDYEKVARSIAEFESWRKGNSDELLLSETIVASAIHGYGGKFDRLARRNGLVILSDFKTSNSVYLDFFLQLGAYAIAIEEWLGIKVDGLEVLRFDKNGGDFQTLLIDDVEELYMFKQQAIRCVQTYKFRKIEEDPRWKWGGKK